MIRKLRIKFVALAMSVLLIAIVLVLSFVYFLSAARVNRQTRFLADMIIRNDGRMPEYRESDELEEQGITEETFYETRYFSVVFDESKDVESAYMENFHSISEQEALEMAHSVLRHKRRFGLKKRGPIMFYYQIGPSDSQPKIVAFVDATSRNWIIQEMFLYMCLVGFIIFLLFFLLITHFSKLAIQPYIDNLEKQKQFITNASHELKTPLAVISANTEMIAMLNGSSKWTDSTMRQVKRLSGLVAQLVTLARMEERDDLVLEDVDFSAAVRESADSYESVVLQQGKTFQKQVEEGIHIKGDPKALPELVNILIDNAVKYCDDGGAVSVILQSMGRRIGKTARLVVSNSYADGADVDFSRFFDRFYRQDESHNHEKSGYGIGLSMAQNIVERMNGKIQASWEDGMISFTVLYAVNNRQAEKTNGTDRTDNK